MHQQPWGQAAGRRVQLCPPQTRQMGTRRRRSCQTSGRGGWEQASSSVKKQQAKVLLHGMLSYYLSREAWQDAQAQLFHKHTCAERPGKTHRLNPAPT